MQWLCTDKTMFSYLLPIAAAILFRLSDILPSLRWPGGLTWFGSKPILILLDATLEPGDCDPALWFWPPCMDPVLVLRLVPKLVSGFWDLVAEVGRDVLPRLPWRWYTRSCSLASLRVSVSSKRSSHSLRTVSCRKRIFIGGKKERKDNWKAETKNIILHC